MARNPLDGDEGGGGWIGRAPGLTEEDLRQWCALENRREMTMQAGWWFFVRKSDAGVHFVDRLEGWKAQEAHGRAARRPVQWYRPTPADTASIHAFVRRCMENGLSQYEFNELVRRTGGAPLA